MSETPREDDPQDPDHLREHGQPRPDDEQEVPDSIDVQAEPSEPVSKDHQRSGDLEEKEQPEPSQPDEE